MKILNMRLFSLVFLCVFVSLSLNSVAQADAQTSSTGMNSSLLVAFFSMCIAMVSFIAGYFFIKSKLREARVIKDLQFMAQHSHYFEWPKLKMRAIDCFYRHHGPWGQEDIGDVPLWMTEAFWEEHKVQKMLKSDQDQYLNVCNVQSVSNVKPLLFAHHNLGGKDEGSRIVLAITAKMQNYDVDKRTGKVVKGAESFRNVTQVWTLELVNARWVISRVEDEKAADAYISSVNSLPAIEDTLLKPVKVMSPAE